jgi:hypothetical protein
MRQSVKVLEDDGEPPRPPYLALHLLDAEQIDGCRTRRYGPMLGDRGSANLQCSHEGSQRNSSASCPIAGIVQDN